VRNFVAAGAETPWLFLNVNARVALCGKNYGAYFASMLSRHGLAPHRVVIELVENEIPDEGLLAEAMQYYTELGCLVAIDDFGAGHSNFERIWRVQPQIVKIDRTTLIQAREHKRVRRVFPSLVALLHEAGCLALIEGVETEEEAMIAMDSGVDFVQGFFFARPGRGVGRRLERSPLLEGMSERQAQVATTNGSRNRLELEPYIAEFRNCAGALAFSAEPGQASANMLALPRVLRCYVLDGNGNQVGQNMESPRHELQSDPRFLPVSKPQNASWARRPYFRRAMADPGQIQISRPYLSITDARMCITISIRLKDLANNDRVCCVDVLWDEGERGG
jgi:EAL domain-containing protein (putative c-di-GMP-specific phosphodiesterase class I)